MIADLFDLRGTPSTGLGLYARQDVPMGTFICYECDKCKVLTLDQIMALPEPQKTFTIDHAYRRHKGDYLMPCDNTKYLNHSCNSNILELAPGLDIVVRDIKTGQEATYDYRVFHEEADFSMECKCGEKECVGIVRCIHPLPHGLQKMWDKKLLAALERSKDVRQPLNAQLVAASLLKK